MGFYYHFHGCDLFIENAQLPRAEELLQEYNTAIQANGWPTEIQTQDRTALEQVAKNNRWRVEFKDDGAEIGEPYDSIKGSDNFDWLQSLAPVIRDGGYAQISGDDGRMWRYMFQGGKCYYVLPSWEIKPCQNPYGEA